MCEPQARNLEVYQRPIDEYDDLIAYTELLAKGEHSFDATSLDPLPLFYERSFKYSCEKHGFEHPSEETYGKGWNKVKKDFNNAVEPLLRLGIGIFFNAHETEDEVETRGGSKFKIIRPEGGKQVWEFINANIENIWYYHLRGKDRYLQIRGDDYAFACTAWSDKFYTPDGDQVYAIPMGKSAQEGYENLLKAFNNEQTKTFSDDEEAEEAKQRRVARKEKRLPKRK